MRLTPRRTSTHASSIRYLAARLLAARGYACLSVRDKTGTHTHPMDDPLPPSSLLAQWPVLTRRAHHILPSLAQVGRRADHRARYSPSSSYPGFLVRAALDRPRGHPGNSEQSDWLSIILVCGLQTSGRRLGS